MLWNRDRNLNTNSLITNFLPFASFCNLLNLYFSAQEHYVSGRGGGYTLFKTIGWWLAGLSMTTVTTVHLFLHCVIGWCDCWLSSLVKSSLFPRKNYNWVVLRGDKNIGLSSYRENFKEDYPAFEAWTPVIKLPPWKKGFLLQIRYLKDNSVLHCILRGT